MGATRREGRARAVGLVLALGVLMSPAAGCGVRVRSPEAETGAAPVILSLLPSSGPAGEDYPLRVLILGRGFWESGNVVSFGAIATPDLPSFEGGTRIEFWVPKQAPSSGEAPPMILAPGEYPVTVTTPRGTSRPLAFRLTGGTE